MSAAISSFRLGGLNARNLRRCILSRNFRWASTSALGLKSLRAVSLTAPSQSTNKATIAASASAAATSQFPRPSTVAYDQRLANNIHLIGSVGVNPDIQYLDSGKIVATSSLSVKRTSQGDATWFFLEFQSDLAEVAAQHVRKGDRIHVAGRVVVDRLTAEDDSVPQVLVKVDVTELDFVVDNFGSQAQVLKPPTPMVVERGTYAKPGTKEEKKQALTKSWNEFFANPQDWYDNRGDKRNPKAPDFKHKVTGDGLWLVGFNNPDDLAERIAVFDASKPACPTGKEAIEKSWNELFANPQDWYDNRGDKRNPKAPDFKHKATGEGLWLVDSNSPDDLAERIAALDASKPDAGGPTGKKEAIEKSWNAFFENPKDWYDNRVDKRNPKAPDFKHKNNGDGLWIVGFNNPDNVAERIEKLESQGLLDKVDKKPAESSAEGGGFQAY